MYGSMFHDADTGDQAAAAKNDRGQGMLAEAMATISFLIPN